MTEAELIDVARESVTVMMKVAAPTLLASLAVGLVISLVQALTQIQEMTLTFVPKIVIVFVVLLVSLPFMLHALVEFTRQMMDHAIVGGG